MIDPRSPVCHQFALVADRTPTDADWDWLADVTNDADWTTPDDGSPAYAEFDRTAPDLASAIGSAIRDLATAGFRAVEVRPVELVLSVEICDRTGLSWPAINHKVEQSPVAHPKPMAVDHPSGGIAGPDGYYKWAEVAAWLAAHGVPQSYDQTIQAADEMVKNLSSAHYNHSGEAAAEHIRLGVRRMNPWRMPPELEPYRSFIGNTGGNTIERLMDLLDLEPNLSQTNLVLCGMALTVKAQVDLLRRLHTNGCLPPAPNSNGGWGG